MTKTVLLIYSHQNDHHLIKELPLEEMFDRHHPYDINETTISSGSKYLINDQLQIGVYDPGIVSLTIDLWKAKDYKVELFINGSATWKSSDNRIILLNVNDILEISWYDSHLDTLHHRIIIVTKIS